MVWVIELQEAAANTLKATNPLYADLEVFEIFERYSSCVEGYILKKAGMSFVKYYLTVMNGDYYYYKHHMSLAPVEVIKGANIEEVFPLEDEEIFGFVVFIDFLCLKKEEKKYFFLKKNK